MHRLCHKHLLFVSFLYKTCRFHIALGLLSKIDHRWCQNVIRTSDTIGKWLMCHFFVLATFSISCLNKIVVCTLRRLKNKI